MSRIRSRHTKPELRLKKKLKGVVYQPNAFGKPDFINYKKKEVIFIDGCFWHKCPKCYIKPKTNKEYWIPKIEANVKRDRKNSKFIKAQGFKVIKIWEHQVKSNLQGVLKRLLKYGKN